MKFRLLLLFLFFVVVSSAHKPIEQDRGTIRFIENKHQWNNTILFKADLDGGAMFLEKNGFTYHLFDKEEMKARHIGSRTEKKGKRPQSLGSHAYKMEFKNANTESSVTTEARFPALDYFNYYIGSEPENWAEHVRHYRQINYKSLYKDIDLEVIGQDNSVKYNFIVGANGHPSDIIMIYKGVNVPTLKEGRLVVKNSLNEMIEEKPYAYQEICGKKIEVACHFIVKGHEVSFAFPNGYNKQNPLIIDPTLIFCSYSGSTADNFGMTATYDSHGNLYAGGTTFDIGYPTTLGAYDTAYHGIVEEGRTDVVITKYDSTGSKLIYSTYIGGATSSEIVTSLIVNSQDELFLYGATGSSDFPTTKNAYNKTFKGGDTLHFYSNGTYFDQGTDIYVAKLNATGTRLMASTFIGGSKNDGVNHNNTKNYIRYHCNATSCDSTQEYTTDSIQYNYGDQYRGEIILDNSGNSYITSSTRSADFPIVNGFDNTLAGQQDAVVLKFNPDLSGLIWSSFLGGDDNDAGNAIAVDEASIVYVTGGTRSQNFPTTGNALNPKFLGGKADGFVTKISATGNSILSSTLIGTAAYDQSYFIQLDKRNNVYLYGQTEGKFPISTGVYYNLDGGQFIVKLNNALSQITYSTVFGNGRGVNISPSAFLVDNCEHIYLSGWGGNFLTGKRTFNMPLTADAFQKTNRDGFNFYLMVLSKDAKALVYATYFGGPRSPEHVDGGTSRFDKKGIIYQSVCAGCSGNSDLPTTRGAWSQLNKSNNCNNGTFKMDFGFKLASATFTSLQQGCTPLKVIFNNISTPKAQYFWDFGSDNATSNSPNPEFTYTRPGNYTARLILTDSSTCNITDTSFKIITVFPGLRHDPLSIISPRCPDSCNAAISIQYRGGTAPISYQWNISGATKPSITNLCPGSYVVLLDDANGCRDSAATLIKEPVALRISLLNVKPQCGKTCDAKAIARVSGGTAPYAYSWNDPQSQKTPTASHLCNGKYQLRIEDALGCQKNDSISIRYSDKSAPIYASADKDTLYEGQSTYLHVTSGYAYNYLWSPSELLNNSTFASPLATPQNTTSFKVINRDTSDCLARDSVTVFIKKTACTEPEIFIPNGFSPNDDGVNDVLYVRGRAIEEMYLTIYDRWGEKVFESSSPQLGWDGRYKGTTVTPAVYAYYLKVRCFNKKEFFKKGNITVIR